jgi:hypothetical protein
MRNVFIRLSNKTSISEKGCWEWNGARSSDGYGSIKVKGRMEGTHRVMWQVVKGDIPYGMNVLHKCDNPCCINLEHLWLGSHQDNMADMVSKHRIRHGERTRSAKLKNEDVIFIRHSKIATRFLAFQFGVSKDAIRKVRSGEAWRHLKELA